MRPEMEKRVSPAPDTERARLTRVEFLK